MAKCDRSEFLEHAQHTRKKSDSDRLRNFFAMSSWLRRVLIYSQDFLVAARR